MNAIHHSVKQQRGESFMPRVGAERLASRKNEIIVAARTVFAARGYEQATISEIARTAGVSDGLPYRYFTSKREMLQAVLDEFYERLIDHNEKCIAEEVDFPSRLRVLIREHIRMLVNDTDLFKLFISEVRNLDDYLGSETYALNRRYTSVLMTILEEGKASGHVSPSIDGRLVRDMLFGGMEHMAWHHVLTGHPCDIETVSAQVSDLLLNGLLGVKKA
jgi:AcrR family transcriptional regulator